MILWGLAAFIWLFGLMYFIPTVQGLVNPRIEMGTFWLLFRLAVVVGCGLLGVWVAPL